MAIVSDHMETRLKGDVSMMNISRGKNYFHDLVQYPNKSYSPFLSLDHVLSVFLNFGHISASSSYGLGFCYLVPSLPSPMPVAGFCTGLLQ